MGSRHSNQLVCQYHQQEWKSQSLKINAKAKDAQTMKCMQRGMPWRGLQEADTSVYLLPNICLWAWNSCVLPSPQLGRPANQRAERSWGKGESVDTLAVEHHCNCAQYPSENHENYLTSTSQSHVETTQGRRLLKYKSQLKQVDVAHSSTRMQ